MEVLNFCFTCRQIPLPVLEKYQSTIHPTELLIDLHYLPCIDYVSGLLRTKRVRLEANEQYQKQSYRNRCYVLTANKVDVLTVPVLRGTHHQPIRDLRIDNEQAWAVHHWRCLRAAYGKAPFFEFYAPEFEAVYQKRWLFLFELNYELLTICLRLLGIQTPVDLTDWYEKRPPVGLFDARSRINPRNGSESYVFCQPVAYPQNFGLDFVPNLSNIDLLFCQGPAALGVLKAGLQE